MGALPRSSWCGGLEYIHNVDGDDGAVRAPYVCFLPLYTMETGMTTWVHNRNCGISRLHNPSVQILRLARSFRILRMRIAISRLCKFLDCVNIYTKSINLDDTG